MHHVPPGGNLQATLDAAQPGDTITLEPGSTYVGNFVLPRKTGDAFITIRSAAPDSALPGPGVRMTPSFASQLPKLRSPNTMSVLKTAPGAHHYRLLFLEFVADVQRSSSIVSLGDGSQAQNTLASVPYQLEVDRIYINVGPTIDVRRGIALNSRQTKIVNSYIAGIKAAGADSQAIGGWNGPGEYVITNNFLEGAGENIMFGGGDPAIPGLVPSDMLIARNHLYKPLSWRGSAWTVKNLFELKNAQRVVVDGNLMENSWLAAQQGTAIVLKSVNQDGTAPWSVVQQVRFTNNTIRNASAGVSILGRDIHHPVIEANTIQFHNNLFANISGSAFGGTGRLVLINGGSNIVFDHNTVVNDGASTIFADGNVAPGFVFTNNVLPDNSLGIKGSGIGEGIATLNAMFPNHVVTGNIIFNANAAAYPAGNSFPALAQVGFVDYGGGDYRLGAGSPFKGQSNGRDPGVNYAALGTESGSPPTEPLSPTPGARAATATGGEIGGAAAENTHVPHGLSVAIDGTTVTLSWNAPTSGPVMQYLLEAGSAPGLANIARLVTGSAETTLVAYGVPFGAYYVRIQAMHESGWTEPSSDLSFVVGPNADCAAMPPAPFDLSATVSGASVQLVWNSAAGACTPTHYVLQAGSATGITDIVQVTVPGSSLLAEAPPGTYYVRVLAANAAGVSAASNEIVVTVP